MARVGPGDVLLDVGTGSGYAAAVASLLVARVVSVERHPSLGGAAAERLARLGYRNVEVHVGDATAGWPEGAPYDAVVAAAAARRVPRAWAAQLAPGGRVVAPLGPPTGQTLVRLTRLPDGRLRREGLLAVRYVPLVRGWSGSRSPSGSGRTS